MSYLRQITESEADSAAAGDPPSKSPCFICDAVRAAQGDDVEQAKGRLVLLCDQRGMIMLNAYPYTNGHLLVTVCDHVAGLDDLSAEQRAGLMELIVLADRLLRAAVNPQGMNVGINLGKSAGAGLPGHIHAHLVPRWAGDTNFMQAIGGVRVIPEAIEQSYDHLAATLVKIGDQV